MILDDEALVERVARAIAADAWLKDDPKGKSLYDTAAEFADYEWLSFVDYATAAIEAVRVHMWDDGR